MCTNPSILPNGVTFGCRNCWQCREVRIQDWVGRCIAESKVSAETYSVTLTYGGGDHERAAVLTYSDVQKYFKRLRKAGHKFKYLVAGEYGSRKGRAHWHAILFFEGDAPPHELNCNHADQYWHHGHVFWEKPTAKAVRYVCKYIQKDTDDDERQGQFMMSKKPPIGHRYFMKMAEAYVADGLSPPDLRYRFNENRDKEGKPVQHLMQGAIARDFLDHFIACWRRAYPGTWWPTSEAVDAHHESLASLSPQLKLDARVPGTRPSWLPHERSRWGFNHSANAFELEHNGNAYLWRSITGDCTWRNAKGEALPRPETAYITSDEMWLLSEAVRLARESRSLLERSTPQASERAPSASRVRKRPRLPMVGDGSEQTHPPHLVSR